MSQLYGWGKNQDGQLGIGSLENTKVDQPTEVSALKNEEVVDISCGDAHSLLVLKNGSLYSCGSNDHGQLGHDKRVSVPGHIDHLKAHKVLKCSAGVAHSLSLTQAGEVFSWGDNSCGQLGRGALDENISRLPKLVKFPHTVIQVGCGRYHCMALTDDGHVYTWGDNKFGQLGLGHTLQKDTPQWINCLKGIPIAQVACGGSHSFILSQSGAMYGWGRNCFGQLGVNDEKDRYVPTLCKSLRNQKVSYISCGEDHSSALTQDGGMFTFGAGTFGQLGHGTKINEILPRKVMELMGSNVTQISSGRRHSLAYVMDSGRLYAFGSGANGQLGTSDTGIKTIPFWVQGPFTPYNRTGSKPTPRNGPVFVINKIEAGGDHCFTWLRSPQDTCSPADYRVLDPRFKMRSLTVDVIDQICALCASDAIPVELEDIVTKVFSSASCLNASFLLSGDAHYGSSSKKHGVDMDVVRKQMSRLATATNISIMQKTSLWLPLKQLSAGHHQIMILSGMISHCIESILIPGLPTSPPDVEALRLYLVLPELHLFQQCKNYKNLIDPFGNSILSLDRAASRVLDLWWGTLSTNCFLKVVYVYKETVIYILQLPQPSDTKEIASRFHGLRVSLDILKKLNNVNEQNGQIIPYHKFYLSDLSERVNLRQDYAQWVLQQSSGNTLRIPEGLLFCNYPFTFDAVAKSLLLQTDAHMQMQSAIDEVNRRNLQSLFWPIDPANPFLVFRVSRNNIVQDTIQQLSGSRSADLKKPLKIVFKGEEAMDEGGVRKEFFLLLLRELLDPKYGMFRSFEDSKMEWFAYQTFEDKSMFELIGCLCGLAIYNSVIIQMNFPLALYKKLLNRNATLEDLSELMPTVAKSFEDLLSHEEDDVQDVFCLNFEITVDNFGQPESVELLPGGKTKLVTKENRKEFVDLYVDFVFNKAVDVPFSAFKSGFLRVCGGRVLELFHAQELRALVIGNENYDFHELEKNTDYKAEYHRYHHTIKHFWDVFHDLSLADKKNFLLFLTGSDKIPIHGMKHVKMIIQPINVPEEYLPVAHTCFNLLDLPKYKTKEKLSQKLLQAIQQTEGFGLV